MNGVSYLPSKVAGDVPAKECEDATVAATCLTPPKSISTGRWSGGEELSYLGCLDESLPSNGCTQNRQNLEQQLNHFCLAKPQPLASPGI